MTIAGCREDIRRYQNLKQNLNNIISYLNSSGSNLDKTEMNIKNNYQIDSENSYILTRVTDVNNEIYKISNYLKNSVIPEIDRTISNLNNNISRMEREERERELQRQREAAKLKSQTTGVKVNSYGKK